MFSFKKQDLFQITMIFELIIEIEFTKKEKTIFVLYNYLYLGESLFSKGVNGEPNSISIF